MRYETEPQSNRAWFAEQIKRLENGIDEANRRATAAQTDLRDYQASQQNADGTSSLTIASYCVTAAPTKLLRSGGIVTMEASFVATASIAQYARLCTLPAGFRPMVSGTTDNGFAGVAFTGSGWVAAGFFVNNSNFDLCILTTGLPNAGIARFTTSWPALA